jgi:hypothetical protein
MANFELLPELVFTNQLLKPNGWLIVEHGPTTDLSKLPHFKEHRSYGNVNFAIFENSAD